MGLVLCNDPGKPGPPGELLNLPIASIRLVYFTYISHLNEPNVSKYTIHGRYGIGSMYAWIFFFGDFLRITMGLPWEEMFGSFLFKHTKRRKSKSVNWSVGFSFNKLLLSFWRRIPKCYSLPHLQIFPSSSLFF